MMHDFILDIGSRTIKLHGLNNTGEVVNLHNITWDILSVAPAPDTITACIEQSLGALPSGGHRLKAIGTEAMRRNPELAQMVEDACLRLDINYSTISQELEAELISIAAQRHGISREYDVVNAGGGSIQVVRQRETELELLNMGITDLNKAFSLHAEPPQRDIQGCIDWLATQITDRPRTIAYTGGERTYLDHFGVPIQSNGTCHQSDFEAFAREIGGQDNDWLIAHSPFDARWMTGAIASNCIVLAFMHAGRAKSFLPSDLNIGHGLLTHAFGRSSGLSIL
jgi:hypothetical protein